MAEIGARAPHEQEEDSGFVYYGRHLRRPDGSPVIAGPVYDQFGSVLLLALPGDHGTAGVGIVTCSDDKEMRRLFDEAAWQRVLGALPGGEGMVDCEPISPMTRMSKTSRTATAAWWWTVSRWCPASSRWRTPGRAPTRRSVGACRSASGTRSCCGT